MDKKNKMKIFIVHPQTLELVSIKKWRRSKNPTSAELIVIKTEEKELYVSKSILPRMHEFKDAQKAAAAFTPKNSPKLKFRNPTRKECIDIYDARFAGLDEAIELLGGNFIFTYEYWTSESDPDIECNSDTAFTLDGYSGMLDSSIKYNSYAVRPVATFNNLIK